MSIVKFYLAFLKIGLLGFGGGYMMIPLFFLEVVEKHHWLTSDKLFGIIALAQTVPGTFATNTATLAGMQIGGFGLGLTATLGVISPAFLVAYLSDRYIKPHLSKPAFQGFLKGVSLAVISIILATGIDMGKNAVTDIPTAIVTLTAFLLFTLPKWNAALSMIVAAMLGIILIAFI
ncbi:MAG: chromate transporter [Chitinophagales bacterium]